jgi:protein-tyrosine phosphatase
LDTLMTSFGALTIAQARAENLDTSVAIEEDAVGWLRSRGIDPGPPPRPLREIFADAIARGQMYLALRDGVPCGKLALTEEDELWADLPGNALYVHGLMVRRAFAGQAVGRTLLAWAAERAASLGKPLLRLDCDATNPRLRAYYESAGFAHRGDMTLALRRAARYEKSVGDMPRP